MKKKIMLATATIASIVAPVAAVVACGSDNHHSLNYDATKPLVKGNETINGKDFFEDKDVYKETFNSNLSKYDKQIMFTLYDEEVIAAKKIQLGDFAFKTFKKEQEKAKVQKEIDALEAALKTETDKDKKASLQKQIDSKKATIKTLIAAVGEIKDKVEQINKNKIDYNSPSFGSKFPLLLKPFDNIKKDKEKYFAGQKDQHMKTFGPSEGAKKWPEQMRKQFGGSESGTDAII
jgi:hypothetical protein